MGQYCRLNGRVRRCQRLSFARGSTTLPGGPVKSFLLLYYRKLRHFLFAWFSKSLSSGPMIFWMLGMRGAGRVTPFGFWPANGRLLGVGIGPGGPARTKSLWQTALCARVPDRSRAETLECWAVLSARYRGKSCRRRERFCLSWRFQRAGGLADT